MSHPSVRLHTYGARRRQRGVVLVITLIALVVLMLAATALFRSVDTATLIASNMALKQASLAAGDRGVINGVAIVTAKQAAGGGANVWFTPAHPLNNTDAAQAYYSSIDPAVDLMADATWTNLASAESTTDRGGNKSRYIIQRMCRNPNVPPTPSDCLLNAIDAKNDSMKAGEQQPQKAAANVVYRVTVRITGPKDTVSYSQAFVN